MKRFIYISIVLLISLQVAAQQTPFFLKGALKENREQLYRNLVKNTINKNLTVTLTDSTESAWMSAFTSMEFLGYRSPWADNRVRIGFTDLTQKTPAFQYALIELAHANYPGFFFDEVKTVLLETTQPNLFAACAQYLLNSQQATIKKDLLITKIAPQLSKYPGNPILLQLQYDIQQSGSVFNAPDIRGLFRNDFLPGKVLMISFQRKNRNFPGLVLVRDSSGNFVKDGKYIFSVPQLARSLSGLPGYLTNGNTPEGIFRMDGFDTSKTTFIGPTTNIQLTMPFEYSASHFFIDSTLANNNWSIDQYKNLLPVELRDYYPAYQSYYAGKAGRTAIIAHGTTVDPVYYKSKPYFPLTPTMGCLSTKEIWNEENGRLMLSDQQKLVDAVIMAGGPVGYAVVINIDDSQKPVTADELIHFLESANQH